MKPTPERVLDANRNSVWRAIDALYEVTGIRTDGTNVILQTHAPLQARDLAAKIFEMVAMKLLNDMHLLEFRCKDKDAKVFLDINSMSLDSLIKAAEENGGYSDEQSSSEPDVSRKNAKKAAAKKRRKK